MLESIPLSQNEGGRGARAVSSKEILLLWIPQYVKLLSDEVLFKGNCTQCCVCTRDTDATDFKGV